MQKTITLPVKYLKPITYEEFTGSSTISTTTTQNIQFQEQSTTDFSQTLNENSQSESVLATTSSVVHTDGSTPETCPICIRNSQKLSVAQPEAQVESLAQTQVDTTTTSSVIHTDGSTPETCPICIRNSQKLSVAQPEAQVESLAQTQVDTTTNSSVIHTDGSTPETCPICIRNSQKLSQTQTTTTSIDAQQGLKILRRGSGITINEQNGIVSTAMSIIQAGLLPLSNKTAQGVKKKLGGDWLVIVYPQGKPIDFNMTCVQGNDYLYFTIGENAFQVCRLK